MYLELIGNSWGYFSIGPGFQFASALSQSAFGRMGPSAFFSVILFRVLEEARDHWDSMIE
jgi:hypothetical protein